MTCSVKQSKRQTGMENSASCMLSPYVCDLLQSVCARAVATCVTEVWKNDWKSLECNIKIPSLNCNLFCRIIINYCSDIHYSDIVWNMQSDYKWVTSLLNNKVVVIPMQWLNCVVSFQWNNVHLSLHTILQTILSYRNINCEKLLDHTFIYLSLNLVV